MRPFVTLGPLTTRSETGPYEQGITLYPLTAHYSIGPFPAHVIFQPSHGPFILRLISSIRLLTARYRHFLLVGQIQPVVTVGPLWSVNTLGRFHSVIKYCRLTTTRYGRPMNGRFQL